MPVRSVSRRLKNTRSMRDQIVIDHLPLVRAIAARVHDTLPVHVDVDDLVNAGALGLIGAIENFDASKEVNFQSYAKHRIRGAILDSLRDMDWASRDLRRRQRKYENTTRALANELGRRPVESEIAARLGAGEQRWRQTIFELRLVGTVPAANGEDGEIPVDLPGRAEWRPDSICQRRQLRLALTTAMKTLPDRYRRIVLMYYGGDMTMREIGANLGIKESRVSQLHKCALEKMQRALRSDGIHSAAAF